MGIYTQANRNEPLADLLKGQVCFVCGGDFFNDQEHATGGIVYWHGSSGVIGLHQPCAERFGVHLIQDARSLAREIKVVAKLTHEPPGPSDVWYTR